MKFHDKLNLLMTLQNIPNNKLAKALSLDPSLISRWRNGSRELPKHSEYIETLATYFVTIYKDKSRLCELMNIEYDQNSTTASSIQTHLMAWLLDEQSSNSALVSRFIEKLNQMKPPLTSAPLPEFVTLAAGGKKLSVETYQGNAGKREAVIRFLSAIIVHPTPCTLLLFSNESMAWMTETEDFYIKWALLLLEVLKRGHRIKIIHTINRTTDELLVAIEKWLPLYMSGQIEPFYYPNYQDSLFKRTLFIAPDIAALTSSTITDSEPSEQLYYHDQHMISQLILEFDAYLKHCRPLMRIFTKDNMLNFESLVLEFESQVGDLAVFSSTPTAMTMPLDLYASLLDKSDFSEEVKQNHIALFEKRLSLQLKNLEEKRQCEWLTLPALDAVDAIVFAPVDVLSHKVLTYSFTDYISHIENILRMLHTHKHFHVMLGPHKLPKDIYLSVKREVGVFIAKIDHAPICFAFNHPILVSAFESYIDDAVGCSVLEVHNKSLTIKTLENWLKSAKSTPL